NESQTAASQPRKAFYNLLAFHLTHRTLLYTTGGGIYDGAYVDGGATRDLETTYGWRKWFRTSDVEKKKLILKRNNVKYWVVEEPNQFLLGLSKSKTHKVEVFEDALPRAFLVGDSIMIPEEKQLEFYYDSRFNPFNQVLLTDSVSMKKTENFSGQVEGLQYPPNKVILNTRQNGEGFLVLLDTFFPGWKVTVDGNPQPIYRANYFYRAVKLGPGNHEIKFSYVPVGLEMGAYISSFATILLLILFFKLPITRR
ncbi:MAG: YfhO family protein, partial [Nitrospinae bacterium]|nr:YfhO family protein [Nitrospinota bacterium]